MQMPSIHAGSNVSNSGFAAQQQAISNIMNATNQGINNQLSIIQNFQNRKMNKEEAQKNRDFQSNENKINREFSANENKLERAHRASENDLDRKNRMQINRENIAHSDEWNTRTLNADLIRFGQANGLSDTDMYEHTIGKDGKPIFVKNHGQKVLKKHIASQFAASQANNANTLYSDSGSPVNQSQIS